MVLTMATARVSETDPMLECGRGLMMSSGTVPTMDRICDGAREGFCKDLPATALEKAFVKDLPTGWCRNLRWLLRWIMRAFLRWDWMLDSVRALVMVTVMDQNVFATVLVTAAEKVVAMGRLLEFEMVLALAPTWVSETNRDLGKLAMSSGTVSVTDWT